MTCTRLAERNNAYRILVGNRERKRPLEDQYVCGQIIRSYILDRQDGVVWAGLIWTRIQTSEGLL
jgi:hypothetical protein